jgi:hypothetical protein
MLQSQPSETFSGLYDSVLAEIEIGHADQAVNRLVGMLDAVELHAAFAAAAKCQLRDHMLFDLLRSDPLCSNLGRDFAADVRGICSPTGERLSAITGQLPLIRALRQRHEQVEKRIVRAWEQGQSVCVIDETDVCAFDALADRARPNIVAHSLLSFQATDTRFDLIIGARLADTLKHHALQDFLKLANLRLKQGGTVALAALRSGHQGTGWRRMCLNWHPETHDEASLIASGKAAGLNTHIYRDESDCILWCDFRATEQKQTGENRHEHGT